MIHLSIGGIQQKTANLYGNSIVENSTFQKKGAVAMNKKGLVLFGKAVALACSVIGMFFTITGQYHESSIAWNGAAVALWAVSFAA